MEIPDGMLAAGVPARVLGELTPGAKQWVDTNPEIYRALARRHASGVRLVTGGLGSLSGDSNRGGS
jgi:carbonic anhydrase/acetyltransferase-like protein (isoleucine patch superfamily)